jgi:2-polyprenyl-6-methoxyphenol hydroxylase-like FAD-dependent oxidoreductase
MATRERRVIIAGGGIGGLAASIALAHKDQRTAVLECSSFTEESGAGIQLGPNATRLLRTLGVLEVIEPSAFRPEAIWLFDGTSGQHLASLRLGSSAEKRYGAPYLTFHRADLHAGLLSVCKTLAEVELRPGFEVARIETDEKIVAATSAHGAIAEGSSLIGADGLWSTVREQVAPGANLRFAGKTASRACLPLLGLPSPFNAPIVGLWLGPKAHLVHYPVRGGKVLNVVAVTEGCGETRGWNQSGDSQALLSGFTQWSKASKSVLERARAWRCWSLYRLDPLPRWSKGAITLLGDAAHPVMPFLAQGAALAIEDAVTLAASFAAEPRDITAALLRYETLRRARAARVQRQSRRFGWLYHLSGPTRLARNFVMTRRKQELESFDWLYGKTTEL